MGFRCGVTARTEQLRVSPPERSAHTPRPHTGGHRGARTTESGAARGTCSAGLQFKGRHAVTLTASTKPFRDGLRSIRASKTSSDSFRTYSSTDASRGGGGGRRERSTRFTHGRKGANGPRVPGRAEASIHPEGSTRPAGSTRPSATTGPRNSAGRSSPRPGLVWCKNAQEVKPGNIGLSRLHFCQMQSYFPFRTPPRGQPTHLSSVLPSGPAWRGRESQSRPRIRRAPFSRSTCRSKGTVSDCGRRHSQTRRDSGHVAEL